MTFNQKFVAIVLLLFASFFSPNYLKAQVNGDYRTIAPGNWTSTGIWEVYAGTWQPSTSYPGQLSPATTQTVNILHAVTLPIAPLEDLVNITGATLITSSGNSTLRYQGTLSGTCTFCNQVNTGDYRSSGTGNWSDFATNWQKFDGTNWGTAADYPGQNAPIAGQKVFIRNASNMLINLTPANSSGAMIIESGGTMTLSGCALIPVTSFVNNSAVIPSDRYAVINNGDYRTTGGGTNWSALASWEFFNGTAWVAATNYPGQAAPSATQNVLIRHNITANVIINPANNAGDVFVAEGVTVTNTNSVAVRTIKNCGILTNPANMTPIITNYRSTGTGNWSNPATWQVSTDGGTTWIASNDYPGAGVPRTGQVVTIQGGHNVTLNISPSEDIGALTITGTLSISGTNTLRRRGAITITGACGACATNVFQLNNNDVRTARTGNWSNTTTSWERYNGTNWVDLTGSYPGFSDPGVSNNVRVFIRSGHTSTLDVSPTFAVGNNLLIENGAILATNGCENLEVYTNTFVNNGSYIRNNGTISTVNPGDFRSVANGNWSAAGTWQKFVAVSGWTAAGGGEYPGTAAFVGSDVFIRHTVTLDVTPIEDVRNLIIESGAAVITSCNTSVRVRGNLVSCAGTITNNGGSIIALVNGDFRSTGAGGNWNAAGSWQTYNATTQTWAAAVTTPGASAMLTTNNVVIRAGSPITVTVTPANNIPNLTIESGATLTINVGQTINATGQTNLYGTLTGTGILNYANIGDYRSKQVGTWSGITTWERYNGSTWLNATDYPGQNTNFTPRVTINHAVTADIAPLGDLQSIVVAAGAVTFSSRISFRARATATNCASCTASNYLVLTTGDYRSTGSGSWSALGTWERFSGCGWVAATEYPGQTTAPIANTRIFIRNTHNVTLNLSPCEDISQVVVENGSTLSFNTGQGLRARANIINNGTYTANGGTYSVVANGDFRSLASGNWDTNTSWQVYNSGTATWSNATVGIYPGVNAINSNINVFIRCGHTLALNVNPAEDVNNLLVENGSTLNANVTCNMMTFRGNAIFNGTVTPNAKYAGFDQFIRIKDGDYRTTGSGTGWNTLANWQQFSAGAWGGASTAPGAAVAPIGQNIVVRHNMNFTGITSLANPIYNIFVFSGATLSKGVNLTTIDILGRDANTANQCGTSDLNTPATATVPPTNANPARYNSPYWYRTNKASGVWNNSLDWDFSTDNGGTWNAGTATSGYPGLRAPGNTTEAQILNGHTMTVNISPEEDIRLLRINAGGILQFPNTAGLGYNLKVWAGGTAGVPNVVNNGTINNINTTSGITGGTINTLFTGSSITSIDQGDYRTAGAGGNWSSVSTWQIFNSSQIWVSVTTVAGYPGQNSPGGAQSVIIRSADVVNINIATPNDIGELVIENTATLTPAANSNVNIRRDIINHGVFQATNGTITFNNTPNGVISGAASLANYQFNDFSFSKSAGTLTTSRDFSIVGDLFNINAGSTFTASTPSTILFNGNTTQLIGGTGTNGINFFNLQIDLANTILNINRTITATNNLNITNNAKVNNNSTVTAQTALSADGFAGSIFTNATNGTLTYNGTAIPFANQANRLDATATNNTVIYNRAGNQGVYPTNYFTLNISNSGTKTIDVTTNNFYVQKALTVNGSGTIFTVNGTTGRLLNETANVQQNCKYVYNANTSTTSANQLLNYNGPGSVTDGPVFYASNFSGRFNNINISNHTGNTISTSNLRDIRFNLGTQAAGSWVYAVRNVTIPDVPTSAIVRFDVVGSINAVTTASAAKMLIGNGFTDDNNVSGNIAGRLDFNFRTNNELSITTSSTGATTINNTIIGNFASNTGSRRKSITWAINTSGGSLNYTAPNGTTESVAANRMDVWDGTTRVANDVLVITNGATMNNLKFILDGNVGSITLENIRVNPFAVLTTTNYTNAANPTGGFNQTPLCLPVGTNFPISSIAGSTPAQYGTSSPASFVYNPGNQFQVQLSDPTGSFNTFTPIGSINSTSLNSNIPLVIPPNILPAMASGNAFRIRIVSTDPPMVALPSTSNLSILSYSVVQFVSGTVASPTTAALPAIQAITTTSPNQLTVNMIVAGTISGSPTYQWKVRKVLNPTIPTYGPNHTISGATNRNFQANGTLFGTVAPNTAGFHFHDGVGLYDLFCEVTTGGSCGVVSTQPVRIALECSGCAKNPRPYADCATNMVFNGTFDVGGSNLNPGTGGSGTAIYPTTLPDPNDPNSEGIIPFDGSGGYATPTPAIGFPTAGGGNAFNVYTRAYTTATFSYLTGTSTFRFNTPYGFSTEYGGVNSSNFSSNMGLESSPGANTCECTMCPENTWSVTTNPGLYHGNFCDANGTDNCWRGSRATWTSTSPVLNGTAGPPFFNSPTQISVSSPAAVTALFSPATYNSAPSGSRMLLANGSPFSAGKMWAQRFKVRKNTDYVFSFWAANMNDIQAIYGVFANCTQIGNNLNLNGVTDRCVWRQYTFLWNSGELDNVEFSIRNVSTIRSGNDFAIDDVMFYRCTGETNYFPTPNKFVWRGFNTDWFNADNWGNCVIPDCDSDVIIPATSTNPAAQTASSGQTYYFPIIQGSNNTTLPNAYSTGHPAYNGASARNIFTANLASVKSITVEYGASFNGSAVPSLRITPDWNLNVCGDFINSKDQTIPIGFQQAVASDLGSSITFTSISPTQQVSAAQGLTARIIGNWTDVGTGQQNNFATVLIRKKSVNQIVQLQDDIDVYGDFGIENGTFDGNGKIFTFGGENFYNGTDVTDNVLVGNQGSGTDTAGRLLYNAGALNTTSGASFDHGLGTVEFNKATATLDQRYYRYFLPGCTVCDENFYNLIVNEPNATQSVDLVNRSMNIENTLSLVRGNMLSSVAGAKEVYLKNPSPTGALINYSNNSYIVTTNSGFTPTEVNLKFRREMDNVGTYHFPVGGADGGGGASTDYRLLSLTLNQRFPDGAGSTRGYFDTRNLDVFPTTKIPPNSTLQPCMGTSLLYRFQFCTGGYWDLTPIDDFGSPMSILTNVNYNLTMPSIPGSFGCSGTVQTFMKRSNDADNWGYGGSCYVDPTTRNGFTSFSKVGPITEIQILPVELLSFDAFKNNQTVDVKWETISERNASHFMVQRSINGKDFSDIGRVEAKGNSTINVKYLFNDERPSKGKNFYRLQQVDLDGKVSYTKIVVVDFEGEDTELQVFPNPSSEGIGFNVILPTSVTGDIEIKVTDAAGRQMISKRFRYEGGTIQLPADFAKGFYTLTISTQKENYVRKLVVK